MDTTKKYVEMCAKAEEEIQRGHKWETGDFRANAKLNITNVWVGSHNPPPKTIMWLPRQDQLQEMVKAKLPYWKLNSYFSEWVITEAIPDKNTTMEQLWLAFVMSERYSKQWNGEKWLIK